MIVPGAMVVVGFTVTVSPGGISRFANGRLDQPLRPSPPSNETIRTNWQSPEGA
jgi:hypothetical protein